MYVSYKLYSQTVFLEGSITLTLSNSIHLLTACTHIFEVLVVVLTTPKHAFIPDLFQLPVPRETLLNIHIHRSIAMLRCYYDHYQYTGIIYLRIFRKKLNQSLHNFK